VGLGFLELTGTYAIAGVAGILAVFAPSGLGVREGVLLLLLRTQIDEGASAFFVVLLRLWITCAELFVGVGGILLLRHSRLDIEDVD
jgi:uncharacterized membrane protein YbhN (UPF0104 family)